MNTMSRFIFGCTLTSAILFSGTVLAAGSITIISPKDGAELMSGSGNKLEYNIELSPDGNHIHVYVDDGKPIIDRDVSGCPCSLDLPDLGPGQHKIVMKEATSSHDMTGVEASVSVTVK
jgi:hypothetical protein